MTGHSTAAHALPPSRTTVVIMSHNYGRYLGQAIDSVLAQTRPPARLVVVDDASDDDTASVVRPYLGRLDFHRVEFRSQQRTRNFGLAQAHTEYVLFLDADDFMSDRMVELLEDALEKHPAARVAYCDKLVFGDEAAMKRLNLAPSWQAGAFSVQRLKFKNFVMSTSLIRRSSIEAFDERVVRLTDWDTWLGLLQDDAHAVYVPQPLLHYRAHGENVSIRRRELVERLKIMVKHRLIRLEPLAGKHDLSRAKDRRSVVVLALGSAYAQLAPWQDLARRNRWQVRAIVGVPTGTDAATRQPVRAPGVVLQTSVATDLEELFRRFAGVVGDVRVDAVIVTRNPAALSAGLATFDAAGDVLRTAQTATEVVATKSLEDLGDFALPPATVRTLLYLTPAERATAIGRARQAAADLFAQHLAWRFRGHTPTAGNGRR